MKRIFVRSLGLAGMGILGSVQAFAQADWDFQCIDPATTTPYSNDYAVTGIGNNLMIAGMGVSGTVTYGDAGNPDDDIPCFTTTQTINTVGRFAFAIGNLGSVQDQFPSDPGSTFRDDGMVLSWGFPTAGGSSAYASTLVDGTRTRFGSNGINLLFTGESNRYFRCTSTDGDINIQLTVSVIGDATQMSWLLTNTSATDAHQVGLWFGMTLGMISNFPDVTSSEMSHFFPNTPTNAFLPGKLGYVVHSAGGRPPLTEHRYQRNISPATFPQTVDYVFGQTNAFGVRIENGPTPATMNNSGNSDATDAAEFALGQSFFLLGAEQSDNNFPDVMFPPIDPNDPDQGSDVGYLDNSGFIQKFAPIGVNPGGSRRITHYLRSTWGNSNYTAPYGAVVDAPKLIAEDSGGGPGSLNGLRPNAMTIRVYLDNVGGYATVNQEVPLNNCRITLTLPDGLTMAPGELNEKVIPNVPPRAVRFVDFSVEADGVVFGDLPYSVKIEPVPGPTKILNGTIRVAATPRLEVKSDANLVSLPWTFGDTSLETILSPLQTPTDFRAFKWDPDQQGYVVATSAERGLGFWIVSNSDEGSMPLAGNPTRPTDTATGGHLIQLKSGWNLIGSPYNYAIKVGELVGVADSNPEQSFPWSQLVAQGVVSGALAYYDNTTQDYVFTQGNDAPILPNRGYWVFVSTLQDVTISFPAVFEVFLPGSSRSEAARWTQSERQWRLKLAARTSKSLDAENYVGIARNTSEANRLRIMEPPITPIHNVSLSIEEIRNGQASRLAQSLVEGAGRKEWKVLVSTTEAGTVNLTWPNLTTVPKNVKFRLIDTATGTIRNLRQLGNYSFEAAGEGTREFKLEAIPGGESVRATIGNMIVSKANGRDPKAPFTINYTLTGDATTTIRILSGSGKEVFSVTRGRADKAGENSAMWALKDNANRTVAPGAYRVELIAETANGERVRHVVPINVIR